MCTFCNFIAGVIQGALGIVTALFFLTCIGYFWLSHGVEKEVRLSFSTVLKGVFTKYLRPNPSKEEDPVRQEKIRKPSREEFAPQPRKDSPKEDSPRPTKDISQEGGLQPTKDSREEKDLRHMNDNREEIMISLRQKFESDGDIFQELSDATQSEFLRLFYLINGFAILQNLPDGYVRYSIDDKEAFIETKKGKIIGSIQEDAYQQIKNKSRKWERREHKDIFRYTLPLARRGNKLMINDQGYLSASQNP